VQHRPYWWDAAPRPDLPVQHRVPTRTDVVVIGGGYTGISAARTLVQAGAKVTVLERDLIGAGGATRNGGLVLAGFKRDARSLVKQLGAVRARELYTASRAAVTYVEEVLQAEGVDADFQRSGHLLLAAKPAHYGELEREAELLDKAFRHSTRLVPPARIGEELGATAYHGGLMDPEGGGVNPGKLYWALAAAAQRGGAEFVEDVTVHEVHRSAGRFMIRTSRGTLGAGHVVLATDGHADGLVRGLRRRLTPATGFAVATAPLGVNVARALIPRDRVVSDARHLQVYFRITADTRMVFGGKAEVGKVKVGEAIKHLVDTMCTLFPRLLGTDIDYHWSGPIAITRDQLPHAGMRDGVHYAVGFNGQGLALAVYLGSRLGRMVTSGKRGDLEPFLRLPFPAFPLLHRLKTRLR
jgi:glycine/D-amino acid oxidase-like deaminating enzyme